MHSPRFFLPVLALMLAAQLAALGTAAQAHEGHEGHDDAPALQTSAAPRFALASEQFELVGVIDGQHLTLYLDHAGDNSPVHDARLELDVGGQSLAVTAVGEGLFQAELAQPLADGETPVTATVMAGAASDLLAGDIDWHAPAESVPPARWGARPLLAAGAALLAALAIGAVLARHRKAAAQPADRADSADRTGGAA
ncbi:hypothetical protein [Oryzisolibacter sp. LB2S]|uniref:hypothetical protein n=1 Tax=Alicycliphilus soli TaxID=3228789 RepID=UPI003459C40A